MVQGKDHAVGETTGLGLLVSASTLATHPCPRHAQSRWEVDQPESGTRVGGASAPARSPTAAPSQRPGVPTAPLSATRPEALGAQTQRQRPLPMTHPEVVVQPPGLALPEPRARPCPCLGCAQHMAGPPPEHAACRTALACTASPGPAQAPWRCSGPGSPAGRTCSPPGGGHRLSLQRGLAAPRDPSSVSVLSRSCVSRCVPGPCRAEGPPRPALTTCSHDRYAAGQARVPPRPPPFCRVWTRPWAEPPRGTVSQGTQGAWAARLGLPGFHQGGSTSSECFAPEATPTSKLHMCAHVCTCVHQEKRPLRVRNAGCTLAST